MYLNEVRSGNEVRITDTGPDDADRRYLARLGIMTGARVRPLRSCHGACVLLCNRTRLALGMKTAGRIQVEAES